METTFFHGRLGPNLRSLKNKKMASNINLGKKLGNPNKGIPHNKDEGPCRKDLEIGD